jgi:signal transduction histidine kinase
VVVREEVEVARLIDEAVVLTSPLAAAKQLELVVRPPGARLIVETDLHKARQILVNLLSNAIKFTDRGTVLLNASNGESSVIFLVKDTGIGIPAEHVGHVFDPFWQVEQTTTRRVGGSGLGLTVSLQLARLLGGDLTVRSSVGVGSEFRLELPLAPH